MMRWTISGSCLIISDLSLHEMAKAYQPALSGKAQCMFASTCWVDNMISNERKHEYRRIKHSVFTWSQGQSDIVGIALVGPWARRSADMDSHLDLLVLTRNKDHYLTTESWVGQALPSPGEIVGTRVWGSLAERQVRLPSGLIVEFGFVGPSWASTDPVDPFTARVVDNGCVPFIDPESVIERLVEVVSIGIW